MLSRIVKKALDLDHHRQQVDAIARRGSGAPDVSVPSDPALRTPPRLIAPTPRPAHPRGLITRLRRRP